uniref:K Homology domain-containing protein n=1 Tax=Panagrolaimus sp. PS1159 TaxID=55785 RepID=A0AC35FKY5_9BILA
MKMLDFEKNDTKKDSHSWKKASKDFSLNLKKNDFEKENEFKKATNSSTLFLHIFAYENSNEANFFDGIKEPLKQNDFIKKRENSEQIFDCLKSVIQNPFEFPRQQGNENWKTPELAQYKASQQLLNPTDPYSYQQPVYYDGQHFSSNMQRKRPLESLLTPAAAPGGGISVNGTTRIPQNQYGSSPAYEDKPPANKRPVTNADNYSYYNDDYAAANTADSWVRGYEREMNPSQFSAYSSSSSQMPMHNSNEYDYGAAAAYNQPSAPTPLIKMNAEPKRKLTTLLPYPALPEPPPPLIKMNAEPKRKLTTLLPYPALPERAPNSKFGLGLDRYGHELPGPLMDEFQDTVKEMQNEIAFLKRHPEVATRIPHAVRILEKECFKLDKCVDPEWLEVDINKPINIVKRILIPTARHPTFNFVGKIIGNRGTTLHNLGKAFKCHINLCGEGSSRDRKKEANLFGSNDEKYMHYGLPMYIQISTIARPHVAHMRIAGFLNVLHKLLIPSHDVHIAGITDGNTWYESDDTYVYEPPICDETADEEKESELRAGAAGSTYRKPPRGRGGGAGSSARGGRGGIIPNPSTTVEEDYVVCYDPDQFSVSKAADSSSSAINGTSNGSTRGGATSARGTTRGRGRGRGAIPIRRG